MIPSFDSNPPLQRFAEDVFGGSLGSPALDVSPGAPQPIDRAGAAQHRTALKNLKLDIVSSIKAPRPIGALVPYYSCQGHLMAAVGNRLTAFSLSR